MPDSDIEDDLSFLGHQDVVDVKEIEKEKALEIRRLLAEGEDFDWSPPGSSGMDFNIFYKKSCGLPDPLPHSI